MKLHIPFSKKKLCIEQSFYYDNEIVSLGCDCHPAFVLASLHLRKQSLPFDWLNTKPSEGLKYAGINLRNAFKDSLTDLTINEYKRVISRKFPYSEFFHDQNLIVDPGEREKYKRRIARLLDITKHKKINYLCTTRISYLSDNEKVEYFLDSIKDFLKEIKLTDSLHIYFECESQSKNELDIFNYFVDNTKLLHNVVVCLYFKDRKTYGLWGNQKKYRGLLLSLKINIRKKIFPKIYFCSKSFQINGEIN